MANRFKKWINLPEKYELTAGDTFELFFKGVILAGDPYRYNIRVSCARGAYCRRKFIFTPTSADVGDIPLRLELSDDCGSILDTAEVTLHVTEPAVSPEKDTYVLCVGDSLTSGGVWPSELCRRLTGKDGEPAGLGLERLHFIGGCRGTDNAWYEGYGGWTFGCYNTAHDSAAAFRWVDADHGKTDPDRHSVYTDGTTDWRLEDIQDGKIKLVRCRGSEALAPSGTLTHVRGGENHGDIVYTNLRNGSGNPFWDETEGRVNYASYLRRVGAPAIDYCLILLGWNSSNAEEAAYKTAVRTFLDNMRAEFPQVKFVLMGLQVPSIDGFANYGCSWNYMDKLEFVFRLDGWYRDICREYENCTFVNIAGQFDTEFNMPTVVRPANIRTDVTETVGSNGVHPAKSGYLQIGDAAFRAFNALLNEQNRKN